MAETSRGRRDRREQRSVRQRIRDTKRLLSKEDLPETVRLTKERVLKCLATELQEQQQEARDKKILKKYKMVKFFDKRKVMRRIKVQQKELMDCTEKGKRHELLLALEISRKELNYIVHFPSSEKYLALYPSTETTDTQALLRKNQLLQEVSEMVGSGELSDASSHFLPPDLLTQLSSSSSSSLSFSVSSSGREITQPESDVEAANSGSSKRVEHVGREGVSVGKTNSTTVEAANSGSSKRVEHVGREGVSVGKKRRRLLFTAAVDQEPESGCVTMEQSRHFASKDDFFLPNSDS